MLRHKMTKKQTINSVYVIMIYFLINTYSICIAATPNTSTTVNNLYSNNFFNFTLQTPFGWDFTDHSKIEEMNELIGEKIVLAGDKNKNVDYEKSKKKSYNLFTVYQSPVGTTSTFNPSIACTAERIEKKSNTKNGKDYLVNMSKVITNISDPNFSIKIKGDIREETISGKAFYVLSTVVSVQNKKGYENTVGYQKYYASILNEHALIFITNFTNDNQESILDSSLYTLSFKQNSQASSISGWSRSQLTETYMRSISKNMCMLKTIEFLKKCDSNNCIKTMGGVTGDCVEYAQGSIKDFCTTYDLNYTNGYCDTAILSENTCNLFQIVKTVVCK